MAAAVRSACLLQTEQKLRKEEITDIDEDYRQNDSVCRGLPDLGCTSPSSQALMTANNGHYKAEDDGLKHPTREIGKVQQFPD